MDPGTLFIVAAVFGVVTGKIAERKGHRVFLWFVFGAATWIIGLLWAIVILDPIPEYIREREMRAGGRRPCPHCDELVRKQAKVCPHCQREIS